MILLGPPELGRGRDFGDDGPPETALRGIAGGARRRFLLRRVNENHRAVLRANVGTLAIPGGRIVIVPEHFEQVAVTDRRRVEGHLHYFGVAGPIGANVLVGWLRHGAAHVSNLRGRDARQLAEGGLHAPETSRAEGGFFHISIVAVSAGPILMLVLLRVSNQTKGRVLADRAGIADSSAKRRTGLLKHKSLEPGEGLWIAPCEGVHTFGMKFPIDVVFLSRKKKVLKTRPNMVRGRIALSLRAHSVLELPAGTLEQTGTAAGDQLEFEKYDAG